jgi:hypothetical protein
MRNSDRPFCDVPLLPFMPSLHDKWDGLESLLGEVPVVALRPVPLPLELKRRILVHKEKDSIMTNAASAPCYLLLPGNSKQ